MSSKSSRRKDFAKQRPAHLNQEAFSILPYDSLMANKSTWLLIRWFTMLRTAGRSLLIAIPLVCCIIDIPVHSYRTESLQPQQVPAFGFLLL